MISFKKKFKFGENLKIQTPAPYLKLVYILKCYILIYGADPPFCSFSTFLDIFLYLLPLGETDFVFLYLRTSTSNDGDSSLIVTTVMTCEYKRQGPAHRAFFGQNRS